MASKVAPDALPSAEVQSQLVGYTVFDRERKEVPFGDIVNATDRTVVIFVRHFFCGSCQEYLQRLSKTITPDALSKLPTKTSIVVVGCGDPGLIDHYASQSECPYLIYADPSRQLYNALEMVNTSDIGPRPNYISKTVFRLALEGIWQALGHIMSGNVLKAGPPEQQGGEVLFERAEGGDSKITWIHRMQRSWGRTEIAQLSKIIRGVGSEDASTEDASEA